MSRFPIRKNLVAAVLKMSLLPYRFRAKTRHTYSKRVDQKFEQLTSNERILLTLIVATKLNQLSASHDKLKRFFTRRELASIYDY